MRNVAAISTSLMLAAGLHLGGCKSGDDGGGGGGGGQTGAGKTTGDEGGETVKIVSSLPRTGSANAVTTAMVNGIRLALAEAGDKAGNFRIVYEDWDDASARKGDWDPEVEAANADKAVKDPNIVAYIGPYNSGAAKISMPILNRASLVMISPANTYPGLTKPGLGESNEPDIYRPTGKINYFRVVPADDLQGAVGARWAQKLGAKSVYILDNRELYGRGLADVFQQTAEDIGLKVVGREGIDPRAQEYKSLMTKIKGLDPDFVFFGGNTQTNGGQVAKDLVAVGLRAKFMAPDGCFETPFIAAAGAPSVNDRAYITFGGVPADKLTGLGASFLTNYRSRYGRDPEAYAVYAYVAAQVVIDSIARAGKKDRDAVRAAVATYKAEDSALGPFSFDKNGDTTMTTMSGNIVHDGKFQFITKLGNE
jgi:branched-chain amino acid transport system substrate-binding protein